MVTDSPGSVTIGSPAACFVRYAANPGGICVQDVCLFPLGLFKLHSSAAVISTRTVAGFVICGGKLIMSEFLREKG